MQVDLASASSWLFFDESSNSIVKIDPEFLPPVGLYKLTITISDDNAQGTKASEWEVLIEVTEKTEEEECKVE